MKVAIERKKQEIDCYIGDVVLFNDTPCMVIGMRTVGSSYGLLALEDDYAGDVIETFRLITDIDSDERVTETLIDGADVVISKGE